MILQINDLRDGAELVIRRVGHVVQFDVTEVQGDDLIRLTGYVAVGAGLAWVTLRDRTLELAIGAHAANNLSAALVAGYVGSAIPSISLWMLGRVPVGQELVLGLANVVAFAWITTRLPGGAAQRA